MRIIHTKDREPWRKKYYPLLEESFNKPDYPYDPTTYKKVSESPFLLVNMSLDENEEISAFISFLVSTQKSFQALVEGKINDSQIESYPQGGTEKGYLFFDTLIIKNKRHSPYLFHSIFKELVEVMRDWKVNISHVFAIAYTPISERLMRRYNFQKVGMYNGHYPIMCVNVLDNVWLKAFIPYIKVDSTPPWPGKVDRPVPEIDPKKRTDFDK